MLSNQFPAIQSAASIGAAVAANFEDGEQAAWTDLERIKVGTGGAQIYMFEDEIDGSSTEESFEAIILWTRLERAWWKYPNDFKGEMSEGEEKTKNPSCRSDNCETGTGDNGFGQRECSECPNNRFDSPGEPVIPGNYCKNTRKIFLLREDRPDVLFPSVLICPPTSLKPVKSYMSALAGRGLPYFHCIHRFVTTPDQNPAGDKYTKVKIEFVRKITEAEIEMVSKFTEAVQPAFQSLSITSDQL